MNRQLLFSLVFLSGVLVSSFSQVLLKKSAERNGTRGIGAYLNPLVVLSYSLFFAATLISLLCLRHIPLSRAPVLDAAGYVFVAVLSRVFFSERFSVRKTLGFLLILAGIVCACWQL